MTAEGSGPGCVVWGAGVALAEYLNRHLEELYLSGQSVLELGAGPGIAGIAAALRGAHVLLTDRDVELLQCNVDAHVQAISQAGEVTHLPKSSAILKALMCRLGHTFGPHHYRKWGTPCQMLSPPNAGVHLQCTCVLHTQQAIVCEEFLQALCAPVHSVFSAGPAVQVLLMVVVQEGPL